MDIKVKSGETYSALQGEQERRENVKVKRTVMQSPGTLETVGKNHWQATKQRTVHRAGYKVKNNIKVGGLGKDKIHTYRRRS